jgi:hypothetical protein
VKGKIIVNNSKNERHTPSLLTGMGIILILVVALIHLIQAPEDLSENTLRGILFIIDGVLALIATIGIYRGSKTWGWGLGLLAAGGALIFFVVSRSIGIPGWEDSIGEWFESIGILSCLVEIGFVIVGLMALRQPEEIAIRNERVMANS